MNLSSTIYWRAELLPYGIGVYHSCYQNKSWLVGGVPGNQPGAFVAKGIAFGVKAMKQDLKRCLCDGDWVSGKQRCPVSAHSLVEWLIAPAPRAALCRLADPLSGNNLNPGAALC